MEIIKGSYRDIFGVEPSGEGKDHQDTLHEIAARKQIAAANLRLQAAVNRRYAQANRDTVAATGGRRGSLYMAEVHEACAAKKDAEAEALFRADNTADYDSIGQVF